MTEHRQALLRIEVPFCVHPCNWRLECKVIAGWNSGRQHDYLQAVCQEIEANAREFSDLSFSAVRLGGGIASMGGENIATVMRCARQNLAIEPSAPVTMRSSISNISGANMTWFKRSGITRYDFELMSLAQQDFNRLNKNDSLYDFETICDYILKPSTNEVLGLVLAYGMLSDAPKRTIQNFRDSVLAGIRAHTSHITLLEYEGENRASNATRDDQLKQAREILGEAGFREYIPLHFARNGQSDLYFEARYKGAPELAFGLGARTVIDGVVSTNTSDLATYLRGSSNYSQITVSVEPCSQQNVPVMIT